jgi:glutamate/aspartate transport system permease protein
MLKGFETMGKNLGRPVEAYLLAAVVYFVMCLGLSYLVRKVQARVQIIR